MGPGILFRVLNLYLPSPIYYASGLLKIFVVHPSRLTLGPPLLPKLTCFRYEDPIECVSHSLVDIKLLSMSLAITRVLRVEVLPFPCLTTILGDRKSVV